MQMFAEFFICEGSTAKPDDLEFFRCTPFAEQVEKRRDQLSLGQVSRSAENDDRGQQTVVGGIAHDSLTSDYRRWTMDGLHGQWSVVNRPLICFFDGVPAELIPERGQHACGIVLDVAAGESHLQRECDDRSRHVQVDGLEYGPAAFP